MLWKIAYPVVSHPRDQKNRDDRIKARQQKISTALAAAGKALSSLINSKDVSPLLVESADCLNDVSRLLLDVLHDESVMRRQLVLPVVHSSLRDALSAAPIEDFLFGNSLEDTVKSAKSLAASSRAIRAAPSKNVRLPPPPRRPKSSRTGGPSRNPATGASRPRRQVASTSTRRRPPPPPRNSAGKPRPREKAAPPRRR